MRSPVFLLIGTTIALTGCRDLPLPSAPEEGDTGSAAFAIVDGATADVGSALATRNTFFLPPLVDDPVANGDATGVFDPTHRPVFRIVELLDGELSCGIDDGSGLENRTVAVFTMDDGPGSETIRVVPEDEHYVANWHTKSEEFGVRPECIYQIQVETAGLTAATADVQLAASGSELKNIETDEYVALKDGSTLVVKVRIQEFCAPGEICSAGFIDPATGGTVSLVDPATGNLAAELNCGAGCADEPFVLALTLFPNDENPSPDLGGNQFPYFVNAETFPTVTFTDAGAVFTVCQTVEFQEDRTISDASLRLFRVDDGITQIRDDPSFASQCAAPGQIVLAPAADGGLFAQAPARTLARAVDRLAGLFTPEPLGAAMFLHGGLNTTIRNEEFSHWGATDVAQVEATVLVDDGGEEGVTVNVVAPSPDFDATGVTDANGLVLFEDLPIFEGDPLIDAPAPAYTVSVDEATLPAGVTCASSSQDVFLDVAGETETVTFECTGLGSIAGVVQDGSQQPIPGANVTLLGTGFGALTDANGQFVLSNIPAGSYTLRTSIIGSTCPDQAVVVEAGGQVNVTVTCTAEVVEGIVIDGILSSGEWDGADVFGPFDVNLPGGLTTTATMRMTNTSTDEILMAIEFAEDLSGHASVIVAVRMDDDGSVSWDNGDDGFVVRQRLGGERADDFVDVFFDVNLSQGQRDDAHGGINDGSTASTDGNTPTVIEIAKGINTTDGLDADLVVEQSLPFFLFTNIGPSGGLVRTDFPSDGWASYTVR